MSRFETDNPSLLERCFAAVFSGLAAGITYAVVLFFEADAWDADQLATLQETGIWVCLMGAVLGFFGGISLAAWLWGHVWGTRNEALISMQTAIVLLVLAGIGYGVYKMI